MRRVVPLGLLSVSRFALPVNTRRNSSTLEVVEETALPSSEVDEEMNNDEEFFDEIEAASQEVHDLSYAIISYLRRADPSADNSLFRGRSKRRIREPVPEHMRRLIHGHGDKSARSLNSFTTHKDFKESTDLYCQWCEKLLVHLNKPVMDRIIESAGKGYKDKRSDGIHTRRNFLQKASWRTFPFRWFKHAPFEVEQLRADIPETVIQNTRFYRDNGTVKYLFTLMEAKHPYRQKIESKMFENISKYNPYNQQ